MGPWLAHDAAGGGRREALSRTAAQASADRGASWPATFSYWARTDVVVPSVARSKTVVALAARSSAPAVSGVRST